MENFFARFTKCLVIKGLPNTRPLLEPTRKHTSSHHASHVLDFLEEVK